jgi:hypothetical protein
MSEKEQGVETKNMDQVSNQEQVPSYVCNKCGNTMSSKLGGYTVHYMDASHPDNGTIECIDCCQLSPEWRMFADAYNEEEGSWLEDYHHDYNCACGSTSCSYYMETITGSNYNEYDHSEECS